jgi:cytochrome c oxidase subunit IV
MYEIWSDGALMYAILYAILCTLLFNSLNIFDNGPRGPKHVAD